jgi:hypothetical protein
VGPSGQILFTAQAQRFPLVDWIGAQPLEQIRHLIVRDPFGTLHSADLMAMKSLRQVSEHRIVRIGRGASDEELHLGHAEREGGVLGEQR